MMTIFEPLFNLLSADIFKAAISASTLRTSRNCPFTLPGSSSTLLVQTHIWEIYSSFLEWGNENGKACDGTYGTVRIFFFAFLGKLGTPDLDFSRSVLTSTRVQFSFTSTSNAWGAVKSPANKNQPHLLFQVSSLMILQTILKLRGAQKWQKIGPCWYRKSTFITPSCIRQGWS